MSKERAAQLAEKDALKYDDMARNAEIARQMKEEHERATAAVHQKEIETYHEQVRYQQELEMQLEVSPAFITFPYDISGQEKEKVKQQNYEEFLKEKLMVDEIVRKIYEEDQKERERQLEKQRRTKAYIEEFNQQQREWREAERQRMEAENRKLMEYARQQDEREADRMSKKKEADQAKERVQAMVKIMIKFTMFHFAQ